MEYEHEINNILKEAYIGRRSKMNQQLLTLLRETKQSNDPILLKHIIWLNDQIKNVTDTERIEWLMSSVHDKFYPPLCIDNATSTPWNNTDSNILKLGGCKDLEEKYPTGTPLKDIISFANKELSTINHKILIEQSPDIGDCSLVASIINIRKASLQIPRIKKISNNLYQIQLNFNGSNKRLAFVDSSRIPTDTDGEQLSLKSNLINDKIMEIACLDIQSGSYDTQGSNVVIDTYLMTGFIPDIIQLKNISFEQFSKYFESDICLMAIGTSDINKADPLNNYLLPFHDYVITETQKNTKQVILQDPLDSTLNLKFEFNESFKNSFYQLYINWDHSKLFKCEERITFRYDSVESNRLDSIYGKPIFKLINNSSSPQIVWLFLETHIDKNNKNNIAYIQRIPSSSILSKPFPPSGSVVDIGLQLLKIDVPNRSFRNFFVYSKNTTPFTLHSYCISSDLQLTKPKIQSFLQNSEFTWDRSDDLHREVTQPTDYLIGGKNFYLNPTFSLEVKSDNNEEIICDVQLHSLYLDDLLNVQIFNINDENLLNPLLPMSEYSNNTCTKLDIPLITNNKYKLIFSRYKQLILNSNYTILMHIKGNREQSNDPLHIDIQRIYTEYGGLAYHNKADISFEPLKKRYKIFMTNTNRTNELFIRMKPIEENGKALRCNIFDGESHECLYNNANFYKGTFVIPNVGIKSDCDSVVILIELEEATNRKLAYEVFIGSKWKISIVEEDKKNL